MLPSEISKIARSFPVMDLLTRHLNENKDLSGLRIGWHCHLTWLTALAVDAVLSTGAELFLCECNPDTTNGEALAYMRQAGAEVSVGADSCQTVLARRPQVISDTGLVLLSAYLSGGPYASGDRSVLGACEITTSGITTLRAMSDVPLPVININHGRLKTLIENFHGVGAEFIVALFLLTEKEPEWWHGRRTSVVGYGRVGQGVACYLKRIGARVTVVENDPVLRLAAHYDGFFVSDLKQALAESNLLVTATGVAGLLGREEWLLARDGLYIFNVGHWKAEVSPEVVYELAISRRQCGELLEELVIPDVGPGATKKVYLAAGGSPANVAVCKGAPEPPLIHLTTEMLALAYLARKCRSGNGLAPGEMPVPPEVERQASLFALAALGLN